MLWKVGSELWILCVGRGTELVVHYERKVKRGNAGK